MSDITKETVGAIAELAIASKTAMVFMLKNGAQLAFNQTDNSITEIAPAVNDDHGVPLVPPARIIKTVRLQTAASLADYTSRFKEAGATLFADIDENRITSVLDYHEKPGVVTFGDHEAVLDLQYSEEWNIWTEINGKYMDQLEFARFLEENGGDIAAPAGADLLECCRDLQALRSVNFKKAVRTNTDMESFSYDEDNSLVSTAASGSIEVPTRFQLRIPVYFDGSTVEVYAFLRWKLDGRALKLGIALSRVEHVRQAVFKSIVQAVADQAEVPAVYAKV